MFHSQNAIRKGRVQGFSHFSQNIDRKKFFLVLFLNKYGSRQNKPIFLGKLCKIEKGTMKLIPY